MKPLKYRSRIRALRTAATIVLFGFAGLLPAQTAPAASRQSALALEQQGNIQEAEAQWRAVLKTHPQNVEALAHIGLLEARQEHYKEAVPFYRRALAANPKIPGLRLNLALALFKGGQLGEAVQDFQILRKEAAAGSAEYHRYTILIGMAYYGLADFAKAAPYLKEAVDADPKNLPLLLALEHCYLWSDQYDHVLDVYHQILTINPDSAEADMVAGEALDERKDTQGATEMFRAAVKANPNEPDAHFGLGYLLWKQKQFAEAAQEFQAELANEPDHAQAMVYLGDAKMQMNRVDEAVPLLQSAARLDPSLGLAHLDLGIIAADAGRNDEALKELLLAEKKIPDDVNVHWRLGRLYRAMGNKEEAKAEFDKASSLNKKADDAVFKKIQKTPHGRGAAPTPEK